MWKEVENGKTDKTRVEKTRRKRGKERKKKANDRRRKNNSKNGGEKGE